MMKLVLTAILSIVGISIVAANDTPYAGEQGRGIKALSGQEVEGYLNGRGMGYAKAAELNNFPGPRHVLDLGHELDLSREQAKKTRELFDAMKKEATDLGARLIEKEKELDRKFAKGEIDKESLNELVSEIGVLEAKIRQVHLKAHLDQRGLLDERQVRRYSELRGYADARQIKNNHSH